MVAIAAPFTGLGRYAEASLSQPVRFDREAGPLPTMQVRRSLGRDYDTVEKTCRYTVHLSGKDTVASSISRIKDLAAMGFTHAIFNMPDVYEITPLETFAKEIIPAVAELSRAIPADR